MSQFGKYIGKILGRALGNKINKELEVFDAKKKIDYNQQFAFELRYNKRNIIGAIVFALFGVFVGYIILRDMGTNTFEFNEDVIVSLIVAATLFFGGIWLFIEVLTKKVILSNSFINVQGFFTKDKELRWSDITSVTFNEKGHIVLSDGNQSIKVLRMLIGSYIILRLIIDKINISVYFDSLNKSKNYLDVLIQMLSDYELKVYKQKIMDFTDKNIDSNMLDL